MLVKKRTQRKENTSIKRFISLSASIITTAQCTVKTLVQEKTLQTVGIVLFAGKKDTPLSRVGFPLLKGLVDVCGARALYASKRMLDITLLDTYKAIYIFLIMDADRAVVRSITFHGWSIVMSTPVLGMTWHYCDSDWNHGFVPIA